MTLQVALGASPGPQEPSVTHVPMATPFSGACHLGGSLSPLDLSRPLPLPLASLHMLEPPHPHPSPAP